MRETLIILILMAGIHGCEENESNNELTSMEEDLEHLLDIFNEIDSVVATVPCEDAANWTYTGYGSKACGGPSGFIAYSTKIDTDFFFQKLDEYAEAQTAFNIKWEVVSDCSVPAQPSGVTCEDGSGSLLY